MTFGTDKGGRCGDMECPSILLRERLSAVMTGSPPEKARNVQRRRASYGVPILRGIAFEGIQGGMLLLSIWIKYRMMIVGIGRINPESALLVRVLVAKAKTRGQMRKRGG